MVVISKTWDFPESQYIKEASPKKQIVLHHTVSGDNVANIINWWKSTVDRVATSFIIDRQGGIHQIFDDSCWGYHLGCTQAHFNAVGLSYKNLNKNSIGIELCSWGPLLQHSDGRFYPITYQNGKAKPNTKCPSVQHVYEYCSSQRYRGFQYYERYTTLQLESLKELLQHLLLTHKIQANYSSDIWDVCRRALAGETGIFSHSSYRPDKSDAHPQVELVNMLKTL